MEQLQHFAPSAIEQQVEMTQEQYTAAVKHAADQIQSGINGVWGLGQRAVRMAYGASPHALAFVMILLNNLPQDAARQTHDWLKKAGITVNRPTAGSKMYWLTSTVRTIDGNEVELITTKKPGDEGFGLAKEKALAYVKTTPPMAIERKEGKAKSVKVLEGFARNRARDAVVATQKRLVKTDPDAARELNEFITHVDNEVSCLYDANGLRQSLAKVELTVANRAIEAMNEGRIDAETLLKVLSGDYKIVLEANE